MEEGAPRRAPVTKQTTEKRWALQLPSFSSKHPVFPEAQLLFELCWESGIGFFQFCFAVCERRFLKRLWVVFGFCFVFVFFSFKRFISINVQSCACIPPLPHPETAHLGSLPQHPCPNPQGPNRLGDFWKRTEKVSERGGQNGLRVCPNSAQGRGE